MLSKNSSYNLENPILVISFASIVLTYILLKYFFAFLNKNTKELIATKDRYAKELVRIKEKGANLEYMATHDFITDIPNRKAFISKLKKDIIYTKRYNAKLALLYIDLDNFKKVNDSYGHNFGDIVLKEVVKRIKNSIRKTDYLARIGGDEFAVMFYNANIQPQKIAKKILTTLNTSYAIKDKTIDYISASIGISIFPDHTKNEEMLIDIADKFMYKAKKNKNSYYTETPLNN